MGLEEVLPERDGTLKNRSVRRLIELRFPTPSRVQFTVPVAVELASMQRSPSPGNSIFVTLLSKDASIDQLDSNLRRIKIVRVPVTRGEIATMGPRCRQRRGQAS